MRVSAGPEPVKALKKLKEKVVAACQLAIDALTGAVQDQAQDGVSNKGAQCRAARVTLAENPTDEEGRQRGYRGKGRRHGCLDNIPEGGRRRDGPRHARGTQRHYDPSNEDAQKRSCKNCSKISAARAGPRPSMEPPPLRLMHIRSDQSPARPPTLFQNDSALRRISERPPKAERHGRLSRQRCKSQAARREQ